MTSCSIDPNRFRAVSFDCYGTLVDWERGISGAIGDDLRRAGRRPDAGAILAAWAEHEPRRQRAAPGAGYREILESVHADVCRAFGVEPPAGSSRRFAASIGGWPVFADTRGALQRIGRERLLVVISNVDRASFADTAAALGVRFDLVVTAEEAGAYKPDLRPFELARERLAARGIEPEAWLHAAQSLYHDIAPARRLGVATAWIERPPLAGPGAVPASGPDAVPDVRFPDLAALARWIAP